MISNSYIMEEKIKEISKKIQERTKEQIENQDNLYSFLRKNGLIKQLGEGIDKLTYFDWKKDSGLIDVGCESTVPMLYLATKVEISFEKIDEYKDNYNKLYEEQFKKVVKVMQDQIEQFIAWGDDMLDPVETIEKMREWKCREFYGLFNGGFYRIDLNESIETMKGDGYDLPFVLLVSPDILIPQLSEDIKTVFTSPNFENYKHEKGYCLISTSIGKDEHKFKTFELYEGYSFVFEPITHNLQKMIDFLFVWSGRLMIHYPNAILFVKN